jgi:hypothetical protein
MIMDFKTLIITHLNIESNLISSASNHFKEPIGYIEKAIDLITEATLTALNGQFESLEKTDEILKIGKECSLLKFRDFFAPDLYILQKGRGINSEIFGVALVHKIDEIAKEAKLANKTINLLMASTTPAILSLLHTINEEKKYNPIDIFGHLRNKEWGNNKLKTHAKNLAAYAAKLFKKKDNGTSRD